MRKLCPECRKSLSASAFNGSARTSHGLARLCRACTNARRRQRDRAWNRLAGRQANLAAALRQGDIPAVQKLLDSGLTPHWSWVCETMREGHLALASFLLRSGVTPNVFTTASMSDVIQLQRMTHADARLTAHMQPSCEGVTPLHVACASDWCSHGQDCMYAQLQVVKTLVASGAELHAVSRYRGIDGATPLFCACWTSRNLVLVQWLLDQGSIATDGCLLAALGHLQRHGREAYDIAEALLAWGLPVDGSSPGGRTPLQAFAHQGTHLTIAWLIAHGADVNRRGPGGRTAAHYAAERKVGPRALALLVEHGADLTARDEDGFTPMEIARLNEKARLVEWMSRRELADGR